MIRHSKKIISILTALVLCLGSVSVFAYGAEVNVTYDGTVEFVPYYTASPSALTYTQTSGSVVAGKNATDTFYQKNAVMGSQTLHAHRYNPGDMYMSFDFRIGTDINDTLYISPEFYDHTTAKTLVDNLFTISQKGVVLKDSDVLAQSMRGVTLVDANKVTKNEWHSISIDWCCLAEALTVYFDGVKYSVSVNTAWKTDENDNSYSALRYGTNSAYIKAWINTVNSTLDIDNLSFNIVGGKGNTFAADFEDSTLPGGHKDHFSDIDTDAVKNVPMVSEYNGKAVNGDTISIIPASTANEVIENTTVGEGCGQVRLYSDSTYATALTGDAIVPSGAVMVVPAVNASGVERIYKTYKIEETNVFSYDLHTDNTYKITGFSEDLTDEDIKSFNGKTLTIPAKINNINVTRVASNAFYKPANGDTPEVCYSDIDFVIPASIGAIDGYAFKKSGITSLSLGTDSVKSFIGGEGFADCAKLEKIEFGGNFVGCKTNSFANCDMLTKIDMSAVTSLIWGPELIGMFKDCDNLKEITVNALPEKYLPKNFLKNCPALEKITFYDANITSKIIVAAYDEEMRMTGTATAVKANVGDAFSTITIPQGATIRVFQFDSMETLVPSTNDMQLK